MCSVDVVLEMVLECLHSLITSVVVCHLPSTCQENTSNEPIVRNALYLYTKICIVILIC